MNRTKELLEDNAINAVTVLAEYAASSRKWSSSI